MPRESRGFWSVQFALGVYARYANAGVFADFLDVQPDEQRCDFLYDLGSL